MKLTPAMTLAAAVAKVSDPKVGSAPYFGVALRGLVRRESGHIPTLAVSKFGVLYWNPRFVEKKSVDELALSLQHEVMHVLLKHNERAEAMGIVPTRNPSRELIIKARLVNLAEDACINENLRKIAQIPDWWITPENLKVFGVPAPQPENLVFEERFMRLWQQFLQQAQGQPQPQPGDEGEPDDDQADDQDDGDQDGETDGDGEPDEDQDEGEGAGADDDDDDQEEDQDGEGDEEGDGQGEEGDDDQDGDGAGDDFQDDHGGDDSDLGDPGEVAGGCCGSCTGHLAPGEPLPENEPDGRSETEMDRIRQDTAREIQAFHETEARAGRSTVPAGLLRWAEEITAPPKIDWQTYLRNIVRHAVVFRPGAVDLTWNTVSRRQAGLGFGDGVPIVPALHEPVPRVGVIFDTSGSMGKAELEAGAVEVKGVLDELGCKIRMTAVDAVDHGVSEVESVEQVLGMLKGGGGTDMRPGFEAFAELPSDERPEVVIVLTDGMIGDGHPEYEPEWCQVIWVLLGEYQTKPCDWGEQIFVQEDGISVGEEAA